MPVRMLVYAKFDKYKYSPNIYCAYGLKNDKKLRNGSKGMARVNPQFTSGGDVRQYGKTIDFKKPEYPSYKKRDDQIPRDKFKSSKNPSIVKNTGMARIEIKPFHQTQVNWGKDMNNHEFGFPATDIRERGMKSKKEVEQKGT